MCLTLSSWSLYPSEQAKQQSHTKQKARKQTGQICTIRETE